MQSSQNIRINANNSGNANKKNTGTIGGNFSMVSRIQANLLCSAFYTSNNLNDFTQMILETDMFYYASGNKLNGLLGMFYNTMLVIHNNYYSSEKENVNIDNNAIYNTLTEIHGKHTPTILQYAIVNYNKLFKYNENYTFEDLNDTYTEKALCDICREESEGLFYFSITSRLNKPVCIICVQYRMSVISGKDVNDNNVNDDVNDDVNDNDMMEVIPLTPTDQNLPEPLLNNLNEYNVNVFNKELFPNSTDKTILDSVELDTVAVFNPYNHLNYPLTVINEKNEPLLTLKSSVVPLIAIGAIVAVAIYLYK